MRDQIVQVSDRRLSQQVGKKFIPMEDNSNKVVVYPSLIFGYTGLAFIGNKNAAVWLEEILWEAWPKTPPSQSHTLFSLIASSASIEFAAMQYPDEQKRHAFVAVGWLPTREQDSIDRWKPTAVTISNGQDANGRWLPKAKKEFTVAVRELLAGESSHLSVVGVDIGKTQVDVARLLKRCARKKTSPMLVANILALIVRSVASYCPAVGDNLMVVSMPRSAVRKHPRPMFFIMGAPSREIATATYLPKDLPLASEDMVQYGPPVIGSWSRIEQRSVPNDYVPPPLEPLSAVILTQWRLVKNCYGDDSWSMAVSEDYGGRHRSWSDITAASTIPDGYSRPHPYYGLLAGLRIREPDDMVINEMKRDKRHLVVLSTCDDPTSAPAAEWVTQLEGWLVGHGMISVEADIFCRKMSRLSREQIVEELSQFLRIPVSGIDFSTQRPEFS